MSILLYGIEKERISNSDIKKISEIIYEEAKRDIIQSIDNKVMSSMQYQMLKNNYFNSLNTEDRKIMYKCDGKSNYYGLKRQFRITPLYIISKLFNISDDFEIIDREYITADNEFYKSGDSSIFIRKVINCNVSRYFLSVEEINVKLISSIDESESELVIKYEKEFIDHFSSTIGLFVEVELNNSITLQELEDYYLVFEVRGFYADRKQVIPLWVDNIIQAGIYLNRNHNEMALLFSYVAFDSFIEFSYEKIAHIYDKYCDKDNILTFIDSYITTTLCDLEVELEFIINKSRTERTIARIEKEIEKLKEKLVDEIYEKICLDQKVRENVQRNLLREKLKDVRDILCVFLNNPQFDKLDKVHKKIIEIKENRDAIVHGYTLPNKVNKDELFYVITYILFNLSRRFYKD